MSDPKTTVGELRRQLEGWPDDMKLIFSDNGLDFYRFEKRGDDLLQMEFNETISRDKETGEPRVMAWAPRESEEG